MFFETYLELSADPGRMKGDSRHRRREAEVDRQRHGEDLTNTVCHGHVCPLRTTTPPTRELMGFSLPEILVDLLPLTLYGRKPVPGG